MKHISEWNYTWEMQGNNNALFPPKSSLAVPFENSNARVKVFCFESCGWETPAKPSGVGIRSTIRLAKV